MSLADESYTQELIKPYSDIITESIRTAWKEWLVSPFFGKWSSRGRATFVWETVVCLLDEKLKNDRCVRVVKKGTTVLFVIKQEVAFKFKFADRSGRSKNIQTESVRSFHDPEADYNLLEGTGVNLDIPRIEVVYTLNKTATQIDSVQMVARNGHATIWNTSLLTKQNSTFEFDKINDVDEATPPSKRRFKGKSSNTGTGFKKAVGDS
ncbi:hypothetical protein [Acinetobacter soli]|uniref:hypothetical protein n=1 Tax=Acinetobacter soli TaxID=487316 RepID=UPI002FEE7F0A